MQRCLPHPSLLSCSDESLWIWVCIAQRTSREAQLCLPCVCAMLCFCTQVQHSLSSSLFLSLFLGVLPSLSSPAWLCLLLDCPRRCWLGRRLLSLLVGLFLKSGLGVILQDSLDGGCLVPAPQLAVLKNRREGRGSYPPPLEPEGEGPFAYPSRACVFSLPALLLHPVISKLASSSLLPTMEQSPTAKQRSPFQLGNPPCLCLCLYPSLAQCLGRALPLSHPLPPWFCPGSLQKV